jgi:hypothetical protein
MAELIAEAELLAIIQTSNLASLTRISAASKSVGSGAWILT